MSDWDTVLAVYWALWAADGLRRAPRRIFHAVGGWRPGRARLRFARFIWLGVSPARWRAAAPDIPFSFSPLGISNRPAGTAGRPANPPREAAAWRWDEIREVGVAAGWVYVNGQRFFPDTGHLSGVQLLELARAQPAAREEMIRQHLQRWLRPAQVRRRAIVLAGRTNSPALFNALSLGLIAGLSAYVAFGVSQRVSAEWAAALARMLPPLLAYLALLHVAAVVMAWQAVRRLKRPGADKRGSTLLGALMLPAQALRLRAVVAEGFFPPQHPLAVALALGRRREQVELAFQTLADLRWPTDDRHDSPLAREIAGWFRSALEPELAARLKAAQLRPKQLLAPPRPDSPASCAYCPRCGDQFTSAGGACPHGIGLVPLGRRR